MQQKKWQLEKEAQIEILNIVTSQQQNLRYLKVIQNSFKLFCTIYLFSFFHL